MEFLIWAIAISFLLHLVIKAVSKTPRIQTKRDKNRKPRRRPNEEVILTDEWTDEEKF